MLSLQPVRYKRGKHKDCLIDQYRQALILRSEASVLVVRLFQKFQKQGPQYFLIDKLFLLRDYDLFFYVHQLVYLQLVRKSPPLAKLLCAKAGEAFNLFLLIHWSVRSYGHPIKLRGEPHSSAVNGLQSKLLQSMAQSPILVENQPIAGRVKKIIFNAEQARELRLKYYDYLQRFVKKLVDLSAKLKTMPDQTRKPQLRRKIKEANHELERFRSSPVNAQIPYYYGLRLPFFPSRNGLNSDLMVGIVNEDCSCFNTRKRVPYRVIFQTIAVQDLAKWERRQLAPDRSQPVGPFFDVDDEVLQWKIEDKPQKYIEQSELLLNMKKYMEQIQLGQVAGLAQSNDKKNPLDQTFIRKRIKRNNGHRFEALPVYVSEDKKAAYWENLRMFNATYKEARIKASTSSINLLNSLAQRPVRIVRKRSKVTVEKALFSQRKCKSVSQVSNQALIKFVQGMRTSRAADVKMSRFAALLRLQAQKKQEDQSEEQQVDEKTKKLWSYHSNMIRKQSAWGHFPSYTARNVMVKGGDDLRQQILVMQLMNKFKAVWEGASLDLILKPYQITLIDESSGLLEFVPNSCSIDGLKKQPGFHNIKRHLMKEHEKTYDEARAKFVKSLAGYSLFTYLLQVKDRHNGNILLDAEGHIVHIDFGFIFNLSPGGLNFQSSPFKFTQQYLDVLDGKDSDMYVYFKYSLLRGLLQLQKHVDEILTLVRIMQEGSDLPCFQSLNLEVFEDRFRKSASYKEMEIYVDELLAESCCNSRTVAYDYFQYMSNAIAQ